MTKNNVLSGPDTSGERTDSTIAKHVMLQALRAVDISSDGVGVRFASMRPPQQPEQSELPQQPTPLQTRSAEASMGALVQLANQPTIEPVAYGENVRFETAPQPQPELPQQSQDEQAAAHLAALRANVNGAYRDQEVS